MTTMRASTIINHRAFRTTLINLSTVENSPTLATRIDSTRIQAFREVVQSRVSTKRFQPNCTVPNDVWKDVLHMTLTSPSGFNLQPTHLILLRSPTVKSTLSKYAMHGLGNQRKTIDASAIAVFCSDLEPSKRVDRVFQMERDSGMRENGYMAVFRVASNLLIGESSTLTSGRGDGSSTHLSSFFKRMFADALSPIQPMPTMENVESWSYKNAGIMSQMYTLAATAHGLSTCMMEGYDARRAKEILRVPDRYGIPLMVATGYSYGAPPVAHLDVSLGSYQIDIDVHGDQTRKRTPRLNMNEVFFGDTFGSSLDFLAEENSCGDALKK